MQIRCSDSGAASMAALKVCCPLPRNSQNTHACPPDVPRRTAAVINPSPARCKPQMASSPTIACSA